jgi:hypothetical protein
MMLLSNKYSHGESQSDTRDMSALREGAARRLPFIVAAGQGLAAQPPAPAPLDLPHPYYYRELYLPQLTISPSGLAWLPDSRELVYSMAGSLWRQRIDSSAARQLTDGPGYDYQPDSSPDEKKGVLAELSAARAVYQRLEALP